MPFRFDRSFWTTAFAWCIVATEAASAQAKPKPATKAPAAKQAAAPVPSGPSTLSGIYTDEQAGRGKNIYFGSCRSCHTPASHTGATFSKWWLGKQVGDLYMFVGRNMPKNDPGSLAPEDVADVVAYLLKMNAMPVGAGELPADADSLAKIRIELKRRSAPSPAPAKRKKP